MLFSHGAYIVKSISHCILSKRVFQQNKSTLKLSRPQVSGDEETCCLETDPSTIKGVVNERKASLNSKVRIFVIRRNKHQEIKDSPIQWR